jgi:Na+-transporting methylmalonyl-CoA/oxaloacetate decarboxylase gamma subunit
MKKISVIAGFILLTGICSPLAAQGYKDLRINEVLLHNVGNYVDNFGRHSTWIEIFNTAYGTVDVGGCYLTNDLTKPKMYSIQRGDVLTKIPPRQHAIFWADNHPDEGTFHTNFTLDSTRFIAIFGGDGQTLIDSITLPDMPVDRSYGRIVDGGKEWGFFKNTTPSTNNQVVLADARNAKFEENDPTGVIMTVTAMGVVFSALLFLFLSFKYIGRLMLRRHHRREAPHVDAPHEVNRKEASPSEVYAAIAFAIRQYQHDLHIMEKAVLTINKVTRAYSPWSSKIYGLREVPQKK